MFSLCMQIDLLAEISQSPRILSEVDSALKAKQMKADVDEYLKVFCFCLFGSMLVQWGTLLCTLFT